MNIQREFYAAGCDAVDSATFGANKIVFAEYGIEERVEEINYLAAKQLGEIRNEFSTDCLLYTSPSPRDGLLSRMPSSA